MPIQKLPGSAIAPGTITVVQLESTVATTVQTGGGPKLTNIQITDNAYTVLDDTAVDVTGGYIKITGTGFVTGCSVIVGQLPAASVTFISSTEVRAQLSAQPAGTYIVYLVNPDGGVGIRVNGVTHSASPAWQTASGLPEQYDGVAINLSLVATDATSYTITSGSLPPGLSLNSNTGVISGTVSGVANDTVYSFTITATDSQLQDSPRTFTVTITVSDPYFKLTTLLLSGSAISANTVIRDSSTNNFNLTVAGDARASNFTPYGTGWSVYFDGNGDYLSIAANSAFDLLATDFTVETWVKVVDPANNTGNSILCVGSASAYWQFIVRNYSVYINSYDGTTFVNWSASVSLDTNWHHVAWTKQSGTHRLFYDGILLNPTGTVPTVTANNNLYIGANYNGGTTGLTGHLSNLRIIKGTAVYTANFTPATTNLTSVANTSLLTCHANRFLDGSTNNFAITRNGDARVVSFNPFNITNTGVNGSMYFDGTGDYLTVPDNAAFAFGSGAVTIETWAYFRTTISSFVTLLAQSDNASAAGSSFIFVIDTTGKVNFEFYYGSSTLTLADPDTVPINQWVHLAVARNTSNTISLYVNGNRKATNASFSASVNDSSQTVSLGGRNSGIQPLNGYLSNSRIVNGTAVYDPTQTSISIPTAPLTAVTNTQLLTLQYDQPHNNHTFLDSSSNQFLITRSGNATQGTFSPFSPVGWSNYFNGGYASINAGTSALAFGTNDFTIEFWVYYLGQVSNACVLYDQRNAGGTVAPLIYTYTGNILYYAVGLTDRITGPALVTNTMYHIAVSRVSGNTRMFVNGFQVGSTYSDTNSYVCPSGRPALFQFGDSIGTARGLGYISNLRVVANQGLYTGTFTPSTAPLTANAVGSTGAGAAISFTGTTVLLTAQSNRFVDNSSNAATFTLGGTAPSVQAFSPFAPTAIYNPVTHGGSAYFDGTGDCLTVPDNELLDLGTSNFTIELWIYLTASVATAMVLAKTPNSSTYGSYEIRLSSTTVVMFLGSTGSSWDIASAVGTGTTSLNSWTHIALVRSASTFTLYVNGNASGTATSSSSLFNNTSALGIAANPDASYPYTGYISNFRVIKGTALYTSNFTPPTAPLTAATNTSLLLNFTDAAILDSTGRNSIETAGDARSSSVITKFTGASMYFDGTGDRLTVPTTPHLTFGTGDFTIEMWINSGTNGGLTRVMGNGAGAVWSANKWVIGATSNFFIAVNNYSNSTSMMTSTTAAGDNTWHHFAVTRSGNVWRLFVDGVQQSTVTSSVSLDGGVAATIDIGRSGISSDADWVGYLGDLRITRGYARYTANFTAPTAPARLK